MLEWFFEKQYDDGFLKSLPSSSFYRDPQDLSALNTLRFVDTLRQAAEMEEKLGDNSLAVKYRTAALKASQAVYRQCWNTKLGLLADSPQQSEYSQYTNIYGILTDSIPKTEQPGVMRKILGPYLGEQPVANMAPIDYHSQFYLSRAIDKTGMGAFYLKTIEPWRQMIVKGLTTTPEFADPSRSDTHAWSAHPIYDLLTIVAGIHPGSAGFLSVRIAPNPGTLEHFEASMPLLKGEIRIRYRRDGDKARFTLNLPEGLSGVLIWSGQQYILHSGEQELVLTAASQEQLQKLN